jgi:N-acetylmuramoyl-L-alanine amidase
MKIAVDMGHCPKSTGASGNLNELKEDRRIGKALIKELQARGHEVIDVTPADSAGESLSGRAKRANNAGADFFCSIHLNAGGGTGTEVYTTSGSGAKDEAAATSKAVAECLGIKNRGHKTANFTVLVKTSMPAMLVEVCFVDSAKDAEAYQRTTPEKIAAAIAYGIVGGKKAPTVKAPAKQENTSAYLVRIKASTLNVRSGAGVNHPITCKVKKGEVYTIVAWAMNGSTKWGKLKSGAGWISLGYTERV